MGILYCHSKKEGRLASNVYRLSISDEFKGCVYTFSCIKYIVIINEFTLYVFNECYEYKKFILYAFKGMLCFFLQIRTLSGVESEVPGVILIIPPPDRNAITSVQRYVVMLFSNVCTTYIFTDGGLLPETIVQTII